MLAKKTKKQIKEHSWTEHSNKSQFFKRIEEESKMTLKDLTLIANEFEESQLAEIFNQKNIEPLLRAILKPNKRRMKGKLRKIDEDRIFFLSWMFFRWSMESLGKTINNKWAKQIFSQHEKPLMNIVDTLYHERITNKNTKT